MPRAVLDTEQLMDRIHHREWKEGREIIEAGKSIRMGGKCRLWCLPVLCKQMVEMKALKAGAVGQ